MKVARELDWLAIAAKVDEGAFPPPMERRVITEGFLSWTMVVKLENEATFAEEMTTWLVWVSRSANAQKR